MLTRGWMEVDLTALVRNARALHDRARAPLIPMVKADAYGLGAVEVTRALEGLDPMAYGVATVAEGRELRKAGITREIVVFTPMLESDFAAAHESGLTPTLGFADQIRSWARYGAPWILSIDTGMARAGLPWREIDGIRDVVAKHPPAAAFTHFHSADRNDGSMDAQETLFREAIARLPKAPPVLHADASAAIVRHGASPFNAIRPGIFMYGVGSGEGAGLFPECVVHVKAPVVELRWVEAGDSVSYEAEWTAPSRRLIATISLGYADGYPRNAGARGVGVVRKRQAPIVGRVTMDMTMLDVTDLGVEIGDTVTMIGNGPDTGAPIDVASVAALATMSPYELLTGLRGRLERSYLR
jgi:alanine racemase